MFKYDVAQLGVASTSKHGKTVDSSNVDMLNLLIKEWVSIVRSYGQLCRPGSLWAKFHKGVYQPQGAVLDLRHWSPLDQVDLCLPWHTQDNCQQAFINGGFYLVPKWIPQQGSEFWALKQIFLLDVATSAFPSHSFNFHTSLFMPKTGLRIAS